MSTHFKHYKRIAVILMATLSLSACGNSTASITDINRAKNLADKNSASEITIENNDRKIGDITMANGRVSFEYTFKNTGSEPVVLLKGGSSCMCTTAVVMKDGKDLSKPITMPGHGGGVSNLMIPMEPNESLKLKVVFDPNAHGPQGTGPIMREIYMTTNSTKSPKISFTFSGNVVP